MVQSLFPLSLREQATFYRAALLLGLVAGDEVVRWADAEISRVENPPAALCDVALTPTGDAGDLSKLRAALHRLADKREPPAVVARLLRIVTDDFTAGRRSASDTIRILGQMRDNVAIDDELREALHPFAIQNMLASVGAEGAIEDVEVRLQAWVATR
ncbi:MAG TPA: hypothetical protein VFV98_19035 [Vicinamibacterales bacterium]|nr:hypothetical protein [Vicinamibacterales bacterium]